MSNRTSISHFNNRLEALQTTEEKTVEDPWTGFKEAVVGACEGVLGRPQSRRKRWMDTRRHLGKGGRKKERKKEGKAGQQKRTASAKYGAVVKRRQEAAESRQTSIHN